MFKKIASYTPTLKESWIMFLCVVICGTILATPTTLVGDVYVISTFLSYILTMTPPFIYAYLKVKRGNYLPKHKINSPYFGKLHPVLLFLMLPLIYGAFQVVIEPINSMLTTPEWFDALMKETALGGNLFWSVMTVCICAPLMEEFLCRGLILRGILENGGSPAKAIFWSAVIFAILHMNPWQALPAFMLGLLFGWLYYRTRCIWIPVTLHIINNSLSTLLFHLFPDLPSSSTIRDLIGNDQVYFPIFAISVAVLALSYFIISKYVGRHDEQETVISA